MAFEFQYRAAATAGDAPVARVAIFPGAWNPPTVAHLALAQSALEWADEVIWTLPRSFPHKDFGGVPFARRVEMLRRIAASRQGFSVAVSDGGLYFEIAEEARACLDEGPEIALLCGRDAAERIAAWDYGRPGVFEGMIARHPLLVAARAGEYLAAAHHAARIVPITLGESFDDVSSTSVRNRISRGETWVHLVPPEIVELI